MCLSLLFLIHPFGGMNEKQQLMMHGCLETEAMGYVRESLHDGLVDKLDFVFFSSSDV